MAHVLKKAIQEVLLVERINTQKLLVGANSLWAASTAMSAPYNSPFLLIEEGNDWNIGVYELRHDEIGPLLSDAIEERHDIFDALSADYPNAVVVTFSHESTEEDDEFEDAYETSTREMAAEQLKSDRENALSGRGERSVSTPTSGAKSAVSAGNGSRSGRETTAS